MDYLISALTVVFSMAAAISAYIAMKKGLTYSAMIATVVVLIFIGLDNLLHLLSKFAPLDWLEDYQIDHWTSIVGFTAFIFLVTKSRRLKDPSKIRPAA